MRLVPHIEPKRDRWGDVNMKLPNWNRIRHIVIRKTDFIKTTTKKIKRQDNIELLDEDMFTLK